MIKSEQECFVLKFADGTYFNSTFHKFNGKISEALRYENILDAIYDKDMLVKLYGLDIEIVPVSVVIKEIKKRQIFGYFFNPALDTGWGFRSDAHMGFYWTIRYIDDVYGALTD